MTQEIRTLRRPGMLLALAASLALPVFPAGNASAQAAPGESRSAGQDALVYQPPARGAPAGRIGGSTRGTPDSDLAVEVLAPDEAGLSAGDQPVLYWFLSAPTDAPVEIVIETLDYSTAEPLLDITLTGRRPAGIASVSLAKHRARLKPGVPYRWSVSVRHDPRQRSADLVASGTIEHAPPPATLVKRIKGATPEQQARLYAGNGYWYDAIAVLSRNNRRQERAQLLEQVGLSGPAAHDRTGR